jgi:hypothetical protein
MIQSCISSRELCIVMWNDTYTQSSVIIQLMYVQRPPNERKHQESKEKCVPIITLFKI